MNDPLSNKGGQSLAEDIPLVRVSMPPRERLIPELERVLYSGQIGESGPVYAFEDKFSHMFGLPNCLAMSSGTAALHTALLLAGVQEGAAVISTPMTAEPTNVAIRQAGGTVIWADVDPSNGNIDAACLDAIITPRTRAIIVVHYAGYPADMTAISACASRHGLAVIEDCAHALGASISGRPIGSFGDYAIFSFQAIKHMTTVDGGVLAVREIEKMEPARCLRWFGLDKRKPRLEQDLAHVGYKYNMNNVTATIGSVQLDHISATLRRCEENGRYYDDIFGQKENVRPATLVAGSTPTYWLYTLLCDDPKVIAASLNGAGIAASRLHQRNDMHSLFASSRRHLPGLDEFWSKYLHIPCGWWVDEEDRARIAELVIATAHGSA